MTGQDVPPDSQAESLRTTSISVQNSHTLEVFCRRHTGDQWEMWVVGVVREGRRVIGHYLTHDDLEQRLAYVTPGDLVWRQASTAEIPEQSASVGFVMGQTIPEGKVIDLERLIYHLPVSTLATDRRALAAARRSLEGRWFDGDVGVTFEPNSVLGLSDDAPPRHPLAVVGPCARPDTWQFGTWQLHLMNERQGCGVRVAVLRVDEAELHVVSGLGETCRDTIAHVFRRLA